MLLNKFKDRTILDGSVLEPVEFARKTLVSLCFEQYLRFFFLDIPDDAPPNTPAVLHVPDDVVKEIKANTPKLVSLLDALQDKAITFEESRSAVLKQTALLMGLSPESQEYKSMAAKVSVSEFFQDELLEFHSWVQEMDETQDSLVPIPFNDWIENYRQWRENLEN